MRNTIFLLIVSFLASVESSALGQAQYQVSLQSKLGVPTESPGNRYPALFVLENPFSISQEPNSCKVKSVRLVAGASAQLKPPRVFFHFSTMNMQFADGRKKIWDIDGILIGPDGKPGLAGNVVYGFQTSYGSQSIHVDSGAKGKIVDLRMPTSEMLDFCERRASLQTDPDLME